MGVGVTSKAQIESLILRQKREDRRKQSQVEKWGGEGVIVK